MHGEKNQFAFRYQGTELPGRIETVQERHGDVQENQVRTKLLCRLHQRPPVFHRAHHLALTLHQPLQAGEDQRVVIGHEDTRFLHAPSRKWGIQAQTFVPAFGKE